MESISFLKSNLPEISDEPPDSIPDSLPVVNFCLSGILVVSTLIREEFKLVLNV